MKVNSLTKEVTLTENEYNDILHRNSLMKLVSIDEFNEDEQNEYNKLKELTEKTGCSITVITFPDTESTKQFKVHILKFKN